MGTKMEIIKNMPEKEYHARKEVSSSLLRVFIKATPAHYKAHIDAPDFEESAALKFGSALHCAILEPNTFKTRYVQKPQKLSLATIEGKAWAKANEGKEVVAWDDYERLNRMFDVISNSEKARSWLFSGESEVSFIGRDALTGVPVRCRTDKLHDDSVVDLKSTGDLASDFQNAVGKYRYDLQAAFYLRITGRAKFKFLVIEKSKPYGIKFVELDQETLTRADRIVTETLLKIKQCQETNIYSSYTEETETISLPFWAAKGEI
jgi:hypothetical protein